MNFVFLVFGSTLSYHQQTYFAILTVLRHKRLGDTVIVYTDAPQYYARLGGTVDVVALDKHTIDSWIDGTGYIFRAKIKAIEDCVSRRDGHLLFMDSDTVLYGNIDDMEHLLVRGIGIMYVDEGHPSAMKGASLLRRL